MPGTGRILIGIGGWTYADWRGSFYPEGLPQKRELEYAASKMTSIEINGTFYGSQKPASFRKWHDETPKDFVFSLKGPRFATNRRVLAEAGSSVERFLASGILELKNKLGPINWQLAPTKQFEPDDFTAFLKLLPHSVEGKAIRHAVEVRHESFQAPGAVEIAREHGVAIVHAGDSKFPEIASTTTAFVYVRIMGTTVSEPNGYSKSEIGRWAKQAKAWSARGLDVYLYVISGYKARNPAAAMALIDALRGSG